MTPSSRICHWSLITALLLIAMPAIVTVQKPGAMRFSWIATNLKMGAPSYVQSLVCLHRKNKDSKLWKQLQKQG